MPDSVDNDRDSNINSLQLEMVRLASDDELLQTTTSNSTSGGLTRQLSFHSSVFKKTILSEHDISIIANMMNAILGVSIFAMPWGYLKSGVIGGTFIVCIIGSLSYETSRVLLVAQKILHDRTGEVVSYPDLAAAFLGSPLWATLVQLSTAISCIGGCIGNLIFLGETVGQLFSIPYHKAILFVTPPLILLSWIRSFKNLSFFTVLSVLSIILGVFAIIYDGSNNMNGKFSEVPLFLPLSSTLQSIGPTTFLFTAHYCVLSMGAETLQEKNDPIEEVRVDLLESSSSKSEIIVTGKSPRAVSRAGSQEFVLEVHPTPPGLTKPLIISYYLSAVLIALLGAGGYAVYHQCDLVLDDDGLPKPGCEDHVCENVILNLSDGWFRRFVGCALIISILVTYVVLIAPAREHIELGVIKLLYPNNTQLEYNTTRNTIRGLLVVFTAMVSLILPYFGSVLGAVGGLTDAFQSFVLPSLIYMRTEEGRLTTRQKLLYQSIFCWGICTIFYTLGNILQVVTMNPS